MVKVCTGCKQSLPHSAFGPHKHSPDGLNYKCRGCRNAAAKREYGTKPERVIKATAYQREYAQTHAAKVAARNAAWHAAHPESHKRSVQKWQEANAEAVRAAKRRAESNRRARRLAAHVEDIDPATCFARHNGHCYLCDKPIDGEYHIDHVIPLSRGGEHSYRNCAPTHPRCNLAKQARLPSELAA